MRSSSWLLEPASNDQVCAEKNSLRAGTDLLGESATALQQAWPIAAHVADGAEVGSRGLPATSVR